MAILENVRSLYNVGSMFRTADAAGLRQLYLAGFTATPDHRGMHKTALGAQNTVPWTHFNASLDAVQNARSQGYRVAALEITDQPTEVETLLPGDFPLCLVVGNELSGISDALVQSADFAIEIPQFGRKHSLNAAVAFGVAVYSIVQHYLNIPAAARGVVAGEADGQ